MDGWMDGCVLLQQLASYLAGPLIIIIINYWIFQLLNSPIVDSVRALFHHWPSSMNEWMNEEASGTYGAFTLPFSFNERMDAQVISSFV